MVEKKVVYNFSPGPCALPKEVLLQAQAELLDWHGTGLSPLEMSHRGKQFLEISEKAKADLKDLLSIPDNFKILFMQGGATLQMSAICYNLLKGKEKTNYITTGAWSTQAINEGKRLSKAVEAWPDSKEQFNTIPDPATWKIDKEAAFFHYCDNETIHGVEFKKFPFELVEGMTLICDMSSNFCSRPIDWSKYGVVYGGAQKNIGPSGCTIVIVREDLLGHQRPDTPIMCDWAAQQKAPGTYHNTPATYPIYVCGLNIAHMKKRGLKVLEEEATKKTGMLYDYIDASEGYYTNPVDKTYRSRTNVVFRIKKDDALEDKFVKQAEEAGLMELKGHRSVGGCRASIYNGMPFEGVEALIDFMKKFKAANP